MSKRKHGDTKLRERLLKYEGNNSLRTDAFVVRLSGAPTEVLLAICGKKMCNERRAAERVLAWRKKQEESITP